jgi:hypothetical protein
MTNAQSPSQPNAGPNPFSGAAAMDLGGYISKAWKLITADIALFVVGYLIVAVILCVPLVDLILAGPLLFGFVRVIQKRLQGQPAEIGDIFQGFQDFSKGLVTFLLLVVCGIAVWIPLFFVYLILHFIPILGPMVAGLLIFAAMLLVQAALFFVIQIAALSAIQPVDAVKQSIRFFVANIGPMILLALVTGIIGAIGAVACGILLITATNFDSGELKAAGGVGIASLAFDLVKRMLAKEG